MSWGINTRSVKQAQNISAGHHFTKYISDTKKYHCGQGTDDGSNTYWGGASGTQSPIEGLQIVAVTAVGANAVISAATVSDDDDGNAIPSDGLQATETILNGDTVWPGPHKDITLTSGSVRVTLG
jgi:hypothetical protein